MERPGSTNRPGRRRRPASPGGVGQRPAQHVGVVGHVRRLLARLVGHAETTAQVQLLHPGAGGRLHLGGQAADHGHSLGVGAQHVDLGTDVAVEPGEVHVPAGRHPLGRGQGGPGADREPELGVVGARLDVFVGVGLDAGGDPDQDPGGGQPLVAHQRFDPVELGVGVGHDPAHPGGQAAGQLVDRTCCCRGRRSAPPGSGRPGPTCSSPPVATSRWRPSSSTRRAMALHRNALPA